MHSELEATLAHARAVGVTQRSVRTASADGRTLELTDGAEVLSFATGNFLGLDRDPRLAEGAIAAIRRSGVSFGASRCFVTSPWYDEAETLLSEVFARPVVLAGSTALAHAAALPVLVEPEHAVVFDHEVHPSVQSALSGLASCPRLEVIAHNDLEQLEAAIGKATRAGAHRVWYCADGVYGMLGDRLPVEGLRELMARYPTLWAWLDDAHGMSWCGSRGAGSLVDAGLPVERTVIGTSLGLGFGAAGGVLAVPDTATKHRIEDLGPTLMFGTQVPPPVLGAVCASARIHLSDEIRPMQGELAAGMALLRELVARDPVLAARVPRHPGPPTPVSTLVVGSAPRVIAAARHLLGRGLLVNPVAFPAVPRSMGGLRWTLTRAHTEADVRRLVRELGEVARRLLDEERPRPRVQARI